jgi:hypothetical protein
MQPGKNRQHNHGGHKGQKHIPLCIPDVALGTEKDRANVLCNPSGDPPLEQLPESSQRQNDADDDKEKPSASLQWGFSQQHLSDDEGRKHAKGNVSDPVIVIAAESKSQLSRPAGR